MSRSIWILTLATVVLTAGAASAQSEFTRGCTPEGVWYGSNTEGLNSIATVDRTGPGSYTAVFDTGVYPTPPPALSQTDWRGEIWKEGPRDWRWKTFAYFALDTEDPASFGFPFLMVVCPGPLEWDGCDSFHAPDLFCDWLAFFHGQDPFEEGVPFGSAGPLSATYKRMPRGE